MVLLTELSKHLFESNLTFAELKEVVAAQRNPRAQSCDEPSRALLWRLFLGVLPIPSNLMPLEDTDNICKGWNILIEQMTTDYYALKLATMPSADKVQADPLSGLFDTPTSTSGEAGEDSWTAYEKMIELSRFIEGDLERLYLGGIPDFYFQTSERRKILLDILLLWSIRNKHISYRQGMHELVAPMLYALEVELQALPSTSPLAGAVSAAGIEAHSYWMFESLMKQVQVLYDPAPKKHGSENQPEIVHFVTALQEKHLMKLDSTLCAFLMDNNVYAQVYGMRWTRLLFGREFPMTHTMSFRVWDWLLASAYDGAAGSSTSPKKRRRYGDYGPILDFIGDFALSMIISVRGEILEGDVNIALKLLMHYPPVSDVMPLLVKADKIGAGILESSSSSRRGADTLIKESYLKVSDSRPGMASATNAVARKPAWLGGGALSTAPSKMASTETGDDSPSSRARIASVERMSKEETSKAALAPHPSPSLPGRMLQKAAVVANKAGSGLDNLSKAMGAIVGTKAGSTASGTSSTTTSDLAYDPVDPFDKKSNLLDNLVNDDDSSVFASSSKKTSDSAQGKEKNSKLASLFAFSDEDRDYSSTTSPTSPQKSVKEPRDTSTPVAVAFSSQEAVSSSQAQISNKLRSSNAAIGDKLLDVADALNSSTNSLIRKQSAVRLRYLADLLEGESTAISLDEYVLQYPPSVDANAQRSMDNSSVSKTSSVRAAVEAPAMIVSKPKVEPSNDSRKATATDSINPVDTAQLAAKKAQRDLALSRMLDI